MTLKWLYINDYDGSGDKGAVAGGGRRGGSYVVYNTEDEHQ